MSASNDSAHTRLVAAAEREATVAEELTRALRAARSAVETRDVEELHTCVERARGIADELARAGGERLRRFTAAGHALGAGAPASPAAVAAAAGVEATRALQRLTGCLQALARESATLGICVRYGALASDRLLSLQRAVTGVHSGYAADGRLQGGPMHRGRHA